MLNPEFTNRQGFMQSLLKGSKFKSINGIGMLKLNNGNVVKCELTNGRTYQQWEGLMVTITNMTEGKLDCTVFRFNDHLKHAPNSHPNARESDGLKIIQHCGWQWYINYPTKPSIKSMLKTIEEHYSFFE